MREGRLRVDHPGSLDIANTPPEGLCRYVRRRALREIRGKHLDRKITFHFLPLFCFSQFPAPSLEFNALLNASFPL